MADPSGTWLVLVRDVSRAIHVHGHSQLKAALVLDVGTGLVRGVAVAPTDTEALNEAVGTALSKPVATLPPGRPEAVMCGPGLAKPVAHALGVLTGASTLPPITNVKPAVEAEDIFDSFIGHMAGRTQPEEPPTPEDWQLLFDQTLRLYRAAPWSRRDDGIDLAVEVTIANSSIHYSARIMGNAGLQHGLVLYPGEAAPVGLMEWQPGQPGPAPAGTLICMLDPPDEPPVELTAKAVRYGWPNDAELVPAFVTVGPAEEGCDPARVDVQRLTVAMAAAIAHDARGPVLAQPSTAATTGTAPLADGQLGRFTIHQRPPLGEAALPLLRVHQAGFDLVPEGTPVVLGYLSWPALDGLRKDARLHRPSPPDTPLPTGNEVPLVAVMPKRRQGNGIATKIARLDPYGIAVIETDARQAVVTLVGGNGAELLMEVAADSPSLAAFQRRLRETKGRHVVMIADEATVHGNGSVYGLFECHQPVQGRHTSKRSKPRPKGRRR